MYLFIGGVNKTENVLRNSIKITNELQERIDSASFGLAGFSCNFFDDVKIFEGFPIISAGSNYLILQKNYWEFIQNNIFRIGDVVYFGINLVSEESGVISDISENNGNLKLTFPQSFINIPDSGELAGKKKFAGNIVDIQDSNNGILKNVQYDITALDYTRIFDKKLLNDTYIDKDARYIINDFCNNSINRNQELDGFDYINTTALRAVWIESGDGQNPVLDTTDYRETSGCGVFDFVNSSGTATFSASIGPFNISSFFGVNSGTPTQGRLGFWYRASDYADITSITIRIGSDSSNYASIGIVPTSNEWTFFDEKMVNSTIVGTPNWQSVDYIAIIIQETGSSNIRIDGIRILENEFFRHFPYVNTSISFDDFKINRVKPTEIMQRISDSLAWYWYIDYNKHIWLFPKTTINAPIFLNETSNNFSNLSITFDTSRVINRQVVRGSDETTVAKYSQVVEGNSIAREWITKNKFKNLIVKFNDGTTSDTCESGTNSTTINATGHGLIPGDYIVNRTRANAVREVLSVPSPNQFTVASVSGQASGDIFSLFIEKNVGVEGLDVETSYNYMSNFNEKSIRASEGEPTLTSGQFLLFNYNEVIPILVQRTDNVSVANMKNILGYTDGIFDGQPITDRALTSRSEATKTAEAIIQKYSNVIITATFSTNQEGLEAGQLIRIKDTTSSTRNIDQDFVIQSVSMSQIAWGENIYSVTCSSLLFGMLELLQQLLANNRKIKIDEDEVINNIEDANETLTIGDSITFTKNGEILTDTIITSDAVVNLIVEPPFYWGPIPDPGYLLTEDGEILQTESGENIEIDTPGYPFIWNLSSWN